jgi:hypothetical protein
MPVESITPEQAPEYFGWLANLAQIDVAASSALTRQQLGWNFTGPDLLTDLRQHRLQWPRLSRVVGYFEFWSRSKALISWRIWTIRFLNSIANRPKSVLPSNSGKCFSRKANSSLRRGSLIIRSSPRLLVFPPPLLIGFPEGDQVLYAPEPIRHASGHSRGRAKCTMCAPKRQIGPRRHHCTGFFCRSG